MSERTSRILLLVRNAARAAILQEGLRDAGCADVTLIGELHNLLRRILEADPDVIVIDLGDPDRDELEQMFQLSRLVRRPIAMFVDRSDSDTIRAAIEAGIGAYVVDGLRKERVKSILDTAVNRFRAFRHLQEQLERANQALDERKLIERAKGLLMEMRGLSEAAAYALMRSTAMNENRRLAEIAQSIIATAGLPK